MKLILSLLSAAVLALGCAVGVTAMPHQTAKAAPATQSVRFWYPDADGQLCIIDREVDLSSGSTSTVLADAYKQAPPQSLGLVFSSGTAINSLTPGNDGVVYVDLNTAFQQEMNAGASYERLILQCVANTFAGFYNADRVLLTVEGRPYVSGHIVMETGEYLTASDTDAAIAE